MCPARVAPADRSDGNVTWPARRFSCSTPLPMTSVGAPSEGALGGARTRTEFAMTHGLVMNVPAPIDFYDALHGEVARRSTAGVDGLLLHVGRATDDGFQVLEVWESKEKCDRFFAEVVGPSVASVSGGQAPLGEPIIEEFEPRGLIIPSATIAV
jgi:hypothetical protein